MKCKFLFYFLPLGMLVLSSTVFSQEKKVFLNISQDSLRTDNNELIGTSLKLVNMENQVFRGRLEFLSGPALQVIGKTSKSIEIAKKDSLFLSLKVLVSKTAKAGDAYSLSVNLYTANGKLFSQKTIEIWISETKKIQLWVREPQVILSDQNEVFDIKVHLRNEGNTPQDVVLLTTLPNVLQGGVPAQNNFNLKAFQDTTVVVSQRITRKMMRLKNFNVHITGLYKRGDMFSRTTVRVSTVKSRRKYRSEPFVPFAQRENLFYLRAQNLGEINAIYQSRLNTYFETPGEGSLQLNIDGTWRENVKELYLRNTWLKYETERFGTQVGTIYENKNIYLQGRGAKGFYETKNQRNRFELGALQNAYRLFGTTRGNLGKSFWGTYIFKKDVENDSRSQDGTFSSTFIYGEDFYQDQKNTLLALNASLIDTTNLEIKAGIYGGTTNTFKENGNTKNGIAGELNLTAQIGLFTVQSSNFISTAYYPGRRRGALNFNERVNLNLKNYRLWGFFSHYSYKPKYVSISQGRENEFGFTRAELGISREFGHFSIAFSPKYSLERRKLLYLEEYKKNSLTAFRMGVGLNYSSKDYRHTFFIDAEIGSSDAASTAAESFQFQGKFHYNWSFFHLNASYQLGAFFLGEVIAGQSDPNYEKFKRWYVRPNLRYTFFNDKLELTAGLNYSHNSRTGNSLQLMGRGKYELPYGFEIFVGTEYYDYFFGNYTDQRIEFGIIKHFSTPKFRGNNNSLEVFVYKEIDGLAGYSPADKIARNQLIKIDGIVFKTDKNGIIYYKKMPEKDYVVKMAGMSNWYTKDQEIYVKGSVKMQMALHKMTAIKGFVQYNSTVLSYEVNERLAGLNVVAVDAFGQTYSTRTADDGSFVLYVPKGKYTASLITSGMKYVEVLDNNRSIETTQDTTTHVRFEVEIEEKQVEYKKFSSN